MGRNDDNPEIAAPDLKPVTIPERQPFKKVRDFLRRHKGNEWLINREAVIECFGSDITDAFLVHDLIKPHENEDWRKGEWFDITHQGARLALKKLIKRIPR